MTRRTRTAALLSATTLLAGATFSLALAPSASADPALTLGTLTADPAQPVAGDLVKISGDKCFTVGDGEDGGNRPTTDPTDPADPGAATAIAAVDDPTPVAGTVEISVTGPDDFASGDTATASNDGTWTGEQGITIGKAGEYTVDATCTLTDPILKAKITLAYDSLTLTVTAPETDEDPLVTCNGCTTATPGSSVTIGGAQFPKNSTATIALTGYAAKTSPVNADGGFDPVTIVIAADQPGGRIDGTVSAPGITAVPFTVQVTVPEQPGGTNPDGDVPGDPDTSGTDTTGTDNGSTDFPSTDTNYTSSTPTLPTTGADTLWPGVIGGLLVLSGGALLWAGRRREEADVTVA